MITQEYLKEILDYNPDTGIFTWKIHRSNNSKLGGIAGYLVTKGYWRITITLAGKRFYYRAHALAWLYMYNKIPGQLDHINGVRHDNRIENLREVTNRENCQNRQMHRNGRLPGCYYCKQQHKWRARITINGKNKHIGMFNTEQEAHKAYLETYKNLFDKQK